MLGRWSDASREQDFRIFTLKESFNWDSQTIVDQQRQQNVAFSLFNMPQQGQQKGKMHGSPDRRIGISSRAQIAVSEILQGRRS
jgi:hypothetical protein